MNNLLPLFIALPMLGAYLALPLRRYSAWIAVPVSFLLLILSAVLYIWRPYNNLLIYHVGGFGLPGGISLVLDGLSHLILLMISLTAFSAALYSVSYMEKYSSKSRYFCLLLLMIAGMNGAVLTGDLFNLFVFLELAALSSAALVAFGTEAEEMEAAFKYLMIGSIASLLIIFAIALVYGSTGTLNMAQASQRLLASGAGFRAFISVLFLIGFFTKAAVAPFHAWLPDAHPSAPAPISAMLSGVLIKALGIYALIRVFYNVIGISPVLLSIFLFLGAFSIVVGSFLALRQGDFKRMLACSTVSQIGYILIGLGAATPLGLLGALFHLFNHSIFKPLLFMGAGAVEYSTHSRQLGQSGELYQSMPYTGRSTLIGALSLSGLPPLNGFWSKLFIIVGLVQGGHLVVAAIAVAGSVLTLAFMAKALASIFFGRSPVENRAGEVPWPMTTIMVSLGTLCLVIGLLFPLVLQLLINPAVVAMMNGVGYGKMLLGGL